MKTKTSKNKIISFISLLIFTILSHLSFSQDIQNSEWINTNYPYTVFNFVGVDSLKIRPIVKEYKDTLSEIFTIKINKDKIISFHQGIDLDTFNIVSYEEEKLVLYQTSTQKEHHLIRNKQSLNKDSIEVFFKQSPFKLLWAMNEKNKYTKGLEIGIESFLLEIDEFQYCNRYSIDIQTGKFGTILVLETLILELRQLTFVILIEEINDKNIIGTLLEDGKKMEISAIDNHYIDDIKNKDIIGKFFQYRHEEKEKLNTEKKPNTYTFHVGFTEFIFKKDSTFIIKNLLPKMNTIEGKWELISLKNAKILKLNCIFGENYYPPNAVRYYKLEKLAGTNISLEKITCLSGYFEERSSIDDHYYIHLKKIE